MPRLNDDLPDLGSNEEDSWLKRLSLEMAIRSLGNNGYAGDGRLGYQVNPNLNVGLSGYGYASKTPQGMNKGFGFGGLDAKYTNKLNEYAMQLSPDMIDLTYQRKF